MTSGPSDSPVETSGRDNSVRPAPLGLDDIVAVSHIVAALTGRPLSPFESSRLKSAYNQAHTLTDLAAALVA